MKVDIREGVYVIKINMKGSRVYVFACYCLFKGRGVSFVCFWMKVKIRGGGNQV